MKFLGVLFCVQTHVAADVDLIGMMCLKGRVWQLIIGSIGEKEIPLCFESWGSLPV